MKNTRTIKVGERIAVSHNGRGACEGIVTENNPASALIYVDGHPYERYQVLGRHDQRRISPRIEHVLSSAEYARL
ncbi:MAG: hypothetical protein ACJ74Z_03525 [Bryobacteraceae bacterium]|jgi:hypothetical protein